MTSIFDDANLPKSRLYRALYAAVEFVVLVVLMFGIPALIYVLYIASDGPVP